MKMSSKKLFLLVVIMTFTNTLFAAAPPPPPPGLPVDGGLGFLVVSGILYGVLKLRNKK